MAAPLHTPKAQRPTVHIITGMRITKSRSTQIPAFTILGRETRPVPKAIAFGGVPTGKADECLK